ncbi:putative leucine-rich repeat-containing protein DDB_G0290503 [Chrysoperla carnea]|uniref:putative leucine-rich repeat-containing protein DDB_G0290503 n=1 Tax=Chrysoperla carnea TaxID=189513 RepID=UPI001D09355D|nr:putative leucine-rich repeat-containing protein DDB_G0290503 [Chrysoperla carnea]
MFKHSENEEDLFFATVNTSSKLASIFDTTVVPDTLESSNNADLTYSAPKQPPSTPQTEKLSAKKSTKSTGSHVSLVKVVYGYKYINNAYESLGKVGFALVEYPDTNQHNIIMYKDKNNHIFNIKVHNRIVFTIQEDKYLTLLDEQKRNWSILFESQMDLKEFYKKLETTDAKIIQTDCKEKKDTNAYQSKIVEQPSKKDPKREIQENSEEEITSKSKTDILTRMAKVGQLVGLPSERQLHNTEVTDSESDCCDERIVATKTTKRSNKVNEITDLVPSKHQYSNSPLHSECILVQQNQQINENLGTLLTENRSQNTEVQMNLLKIENKIDQLFGKVRNDNENDVTAEIQKLQLQNEKLKLELQKIELNKLLSQDQKILTEKMEIGVQSSSNLSKDDSNLDCIGEISSEIKTLRENCEKLLKETENIEKRNRIQELKIKDLEVHYFQKQPVPKLDGIDEEAVIQSINEFTEENSGIRDKIKQLTDSMQEYVSAMEIHERKMYQLKKYYNLLDVNLNEKNDSMNEMGRKLNEFDQHIEQIQQIKDKLDETLKSIHYFGDKISKQDDKLNEIINNFENHPPIDHSAITTNTSLSDVDISICSACLQSKANLKHKEETPKNSDSKITELDKEGEDISEIAKRKIGDNIAPFIKEEMNSLFSELQNVLKDECRLEATTMIVQATYRIIHNINSTV